MIIGELSMQNFSALPPEATLVDAGRALQTTGSPVLVVIQDGQLLGTVSDRDLAVKGCGGGRRPEAVTVLDICDRNPAVCPIGTRLSRALEMMKERSQPWLVVVGHDDQVAGVVSLDSLISVLAGLVPEEGGGGPEPEYVQRVRGQGRGD